MHSERQGYRHLSDTWYSAAKQRYGGTDLDTKTAIYEACGKAYRALMKTDCDITAPEARSAVDGALDGNPHKGTILAAFDAVKADFGQDKRVSNPKPSPRPSRPTGKRVHGLD